MLYKSQILSSITTRIKTGVISFGMIANCAVRYYLPLQQGLRPHRCTSQACRRASVRYYLPLQQGLRRTGMSQTARQQPGVRYYLPLQQGLRLVCQNLITSGNQCQILSSITTRIKTTLTCSQTANCVRQILSSITTRIKTLITIIVDLYITSQILSSITTRIKTWITSAKRNNKTSVRYYLPLQQGLRLAPVAPASSSILLSDTIFHYNKD